MPRLKEPAAKRLGAYPSTSSVARCAFLLGGFFSALVVPCSAAAQNQYVYLSSPSPGSSAAQQTLSGFLLDPVKGSLTLVTGSPFPERFDPEQMALHPSGKFLFIVNSSSGTNNVSVFQIDPSTGALTENPHSPFSTSGGSTPQVIVSEPTGRYLYVGNFQSLNSNSTGIVNSYQIDQATGDLTPTSAPATSTPVNPVGLVSDPTGKRLYAYGGSNPAAGLNGAAIQEYTIDSATGNLAPVSGGGIGTSPRCLAMDPKGRFLFSGRGQAQGFIDSNPIAAADGSIQTPVTFSLAPNTLPESLAVDNGGNFLYAVVAGNLRGFSIDQTTGALTEIQSSPFGLPLLL